MGFSRQECWSRLPSPPQEDLPQPGMNPHLLPLLHWQADSLPLSHLGSSLSDSKSAKKMYFIVTKNLSQKYLEHDL